MTLQLEPQTYGKSIPNLRHTVSVCYLYHWHTFSALGSPLHHLTRCHGEMGCLALRRLCVHSLTRSTKVALFLLYKATSSGMSDCYFAGGYAQCPVYIWRKAWSKHPTEQTPEHYWTLSQSSTTIVPSSGELRRVTGRRMLLFVGRVITNPSARHPFRAGCCLSGSSLN